MAVNLGAPGDRRDADGKMWFGYPRPGLPGDRAAMGFSFKLGVELADGGGYFRGNDAADSMAGVDRPWVFASGVRGLKRCMLPLLGENDEPGKYTVTLYLADVADQTVGSALSYIKLQGKKVAGEGEGPDGNLRTSVVKFEGVEVNRNLEIEIVPGGSVPVLCGVEVLRASSD